MTAVTGVIAGLAVAAAATPAQTDYSPSPSPTPTCDLSAKLVPTCPAHALFGAASYDRSAPQSWRARMTSASVRYGRQVTIQHSYTRAPKVPFDPATRQGAGEVDVATSGTGIVWDDWKPSLDWSQATGGNQQVDNRIAAAADHVKAVGPHRVMLGIAPEPERVVGGGTDCKTKGGQPGGNTPANYKAMWTNVHRIFAQHGVTNVVWVMNYMGYAGWNCLVPQLWPGNDLVDWVAWDPYAHGRSFMDMVDVFYDYLTANSTAEHDYSSKPYMLGEYGDGSRTQEPVYSFYDQARDALAANAYPNLRGYVVFDTWQVDPDDLRTGFDAEHRPDPVEQRHFNDFARSSRFLQSVAN